MPPVSDSIPSSSEPLRIAVVGSRGFTDWDLFCKELDRLLSDKKVGSLVSGGAEGADQMAERYGALKGIPVTVFEAHWDLYGSKAGPRRNKQIVANSDLVVAFWDGLSTGTRMTIAWAQQQGLEVIVIPFSWGGRWSSQ